MSRCKADKLRLKTSNKGAWSKKKFNTFNIVHVKVTEEGRILVIVRHTNRFGSLQIMKSV